MKLITPISEKKRAELEHELETQKERFLNASRRGLDAFKTDLSIMRLIQNYPIETAILIMTGGYAVTRLLQARRNRQYRDAQEVG